MSAQPFLIGQRFGRLVLQGDGPRIRNSNGKPRRTYKLRCDCGSEISVPAYNLRNGNSTSCGCARREKASARMAAPRLAAGTRFSRLVVIEEVEPLIDKAGAKLQRYRCDCDCGSEAVVEGRRLRAGTTRSCGCLAADVARQRLRTHGEGSNSRRTPEYASWANLIQRCTNPNHEAAHNYDERGITVCARWRDSFEAFLADMGRQPWPGATIERENNDGSYEPENCRWATRKEQGNNKRTNIVVEYRGCAMTLSQACEATGVSYHKAYQRLRAGWPIKRTLKP